MAHSMAVPIRNQLDYPYGNHDSSRNDCGPTALSMIWEYLTGVFINPGKLHDQIRADGHSDAHTGYMTVTQLGWWIEHVGRKRWLYRYGQSDQAYLDSVCSHIDKGHPVIVLIVANRTQMSGGHFVVARGYYWEGGTCYFQINNPWGGVREALSASQLLRYANPKSNYWLVIDAVRQVTAPSYSTRPESWSARVGSSAARLRTGPGTRYAILDTLAPGTLLKFSKYTDEGEHIAGGDPPRRWHYNGRGWIADAVLDQDSFRKLS